MVKFNVQFFLGNVRAKCKHCESYISVKHKLRLSDAVVKNQLKITKNCKTFSYA